MLEGDLQQRLARLEAVEEIKRLKARYCEFCDRQYDADGIAGLFAEGGTWEGEQFGRHIGRNEIRAFFARISSEIVFAAHLVLNPIIEFTDAEHARARWRLIMPATVRTPGEKEARWLVGAYDDHHVRVDGVWLFQNLRFHANFFAPHLGSWAEIAVD
jgi:SnoaL-like domain